MSINSALAPVAFAGILIQIASVALGDHIVLKSGWAYDGDVISQNNRTITLRVSVPDSALTFNKKIDKSDIKGWIQTQHYGVPYVEIPVIGVIGADVTVESIRAALDAARQVKPAYVVLVVNSGGGSIDAMYGITDELISASRNFKIIIYVQKAYSAAAVLAMSFPKIYMTPDAVIGAAVPLEENFDGSSKDLQAKFASAVEAKERTYVNNAGHNDLLLMGMMELAPEIYLTHENGQPILNTAGPGKLIKASGEILTLTASEANECGLANITADMTGLGKKLTGGAWYACSLQPWNAAIGTVASARELQQEQSEKAQHEAIRNTAIARVRPQVMAIQQRMIQLASKAAAANRAINDLIVTTNQEIDRINANTFLTLDQASAQIQNARTACENSIAPLQAEADAATSELNTLRQQENQLIASIPDE